MCDHRSINGLLLLSAFVLGSIAAWAAESVLVSFCEQMPSLRGIAVLMLLPALAFFCGSLALGKLWLLLLSFLSGVQIRTISFLLLSGKLEQRPEQALPVMAFSVLAFFALSLPGMRSAGRIYSALRRSGAEELKETRDLLLLRLCLFLLLFLGFYALSILSDRL